MNEVAKKWVAALRSGEYKQGQGRLVSNDSYCCLGVLCELFMKEHPLQLTRIGNWYSSSQTEDIIYLPSIVRRWSKLKEKDGGFRTDSLSNLNDRGKSFSEIADLIEKNHKELFHA